MPSPKSEVDRGLLEHLRDHALTPEVIDTILREIRREVEERLALREVDTSSVQNELRQMKTEQRNLARAVAMGTEIPELLAEMNERSARIRQLDAELIAAKRTPEAVSELMADVERSARAKLEALSDTLTYERDTLRELFVALFPEGLVFTPTPRKNGKRRVWAVSGSADLGVSNLRCDPSETHRKLSVQIDWIAGG